MAKIVIRPDGNLVLFSNALNSLSEGQARKALARAVNRVTNTVHGRVIRAIRKQSDIPTTIIRQQIKKRLASTSLGQGALEGVIWATGKPISLKHFKPRQTSVGVKAKWGGEWHMLTGAFMGPRPGVIAPRLGGHVWLRTSSARLPIELQYGPSVPEELVRGESARIFEETVATMLPARVMHEVGRLLPG